MEEYYVIRAIRLGMGESFLRKHGIWPWNENEHDFWMERLMPEFYEEGFLHEGLMSTSFPAQPENEPQAEPQGPVWEESRFPVTTHSDPGSNVLSFEVVARPTEFLAWAHKQDATTRTEGRPHYSEEEWVKEAGKFVGILRHNPKNVGFRFS